MMGYGEKKKVTKKQPNPKVNKILESVKEEFGYKDTLKEVGAAAEYRKYIKNIDNFFGRSFKKKHETPFSGFFGC